MERLDKLSSELLKTTSKTNEESREDGRHDFPPDKQLAVEFVSDKYDALLKELKLVKSRVDLISRRCEDICTAIEHMESCSYQYNIKITEMPLLGEQESSEQTSNLCLRLFRALRITDVSILDIDVALSVPTHRPSNKPNAVICKFTRRLAKEQVMTVHRGVGDVQASQLGFKSHVTLSDLSIYDHLTPRLQELHHEAKKFKAARNYKFVGLNTAWSSFIRRSPRKLSS